MTASKDRETKNQATEPKVRGSNLWLTLDSIKNGFCAPQRPASGRCGDTNYWKSFVYAPLAVAMGDPSCLSLFGSDEKAHRLLAEHLTAEFRVKTMSRDRTVDEWKLRATRPDNHWFDCLVGTAVAANIQDVTLTSLATKTTAPRQRIRLSQLQARKR